MHTPRFEWTSPELRSTQQRSCSCLVGKWDETPDDTEGLCQMNSSTSYCLVSGKWQKIAVKMDTAKICWMFKIKIQLFAGIIWANQSIDWFYYTVNRLDNRDCLSTIGLAWSSFQPLLSVVLISTSLSLLTSKSRESIDETSFPPFCCSFFISFCKN